MLVSCGLLLFSFFFNDTATTEIYTLSLHDALPILGGGSKAAAALLGLRDRPTAIFAGSDRSEEHTSELQSLRHLVCRLLLEKKKKIERLRQKQRLHKLVDTQVISNICHAYLRID